MRRGFTLAEVLIGASLLLAMLLVIGTLLLWGLDGSLVGQAQQKTQQEARTMLDALRSDMNASAEAPLTGSPDMPSSVLLPSGYQTIPADDIYTRPLPNSAVPTEYDAENIVAFTIMNPEQSSSTFIPTLLADQTGQPEFALVVYYVTDSTGEDVTQYQAFDTEGNPVPSSALGVSVKNPAGRNQSSEGGHILWRNVYNVTSSQPLINSGGWTVNFADLDGPNGSAVSVGRTLADPIQSDAVVQLDAGDALEFNVHHADLDNGSDPTYKTICDRHVFQIDALALREVRTHLSNTHSKVAKLSDSSAIRTFQ